MGARARRILGAAVGAIILALQILIANFLCFGLGYRHAAGVDDSNLLVNILSGSFLIVLGGTFAFVAARNIGERISAGSLGLPAIYIANFGHIVAVWYFDAPDIWDLIDWVRMTGIE